MRITFVLPVIAQNGGIRVVGIYAEKLRALGHEVTVVSRMPQQHSLLRRGLNRLRGKATRHDPKATAFLDPIGKAHHLIPWKFPIDARDVPDADLIVATWWRTAFEVAALPPEKGRKVYFVQHHEVHKELPWDLSAGSYYLPLKKITIADWLVDTMAQRYGDPDVVKVENSVDTVQFNAPVRDRNTRPRVGFLYSPTYFKGVDVSLKAIEIARAQVPDLQVLAFGAHPPSTDLPLPEGCEFHLLPAQDKLWDLYAKCDVWLFGSRAEGFGLPILEAMACRTPVVATRSGAAPDLIEDGRNGYLVDVEDTEGLGAHLIDVLSLSPGDWRAMSDAAYAQVHSYSWDDAARAFEAALRDALEERMNGPAAQDRG